MSGMADNKILNQMKVSNHILQKEIDDELET
jgi:hypothetical protein